MSSITHKQPLRDPSAPALSKGDQSRLKILKFSLGVFGRFGYEGASTRALADAAGVNLGAIQYHFGGKEGLYLAAAEYVADSIAADIAASLRLAEEALNAEAGEEELFGHLAGILERFTARIVAQDDSRLFARFIFREQMDATAAFDTLYDRAMSKLIDTVTRLVARLRGEPVRSSEIKVRALALLGQVIIFETSRAMVKRQMGWKRIRKSELATIQRVIRDHARLLVECPLAE